MNLPENFEKLKNISSKLGQINEELIKEWDTPSAKLYTSAFDDMQSYILKLIEKYEHACEEKETVKSEKLSDFSF